MQVLGSGAAVLPKVRGERPDLIVLDLMLPGLDGLMVCQALRSDPLTAAIPIIMVTARGEEADRIAGLELGADDYVTKPFSAKELAARVTRAAAAHAARRSGRADRPLRADHDRRRRGTS